MAEVATSVEQAQLNLERQFHAERETTGQWLQDSTLRVAKVKKRVVWENMDLLDREGKPTGEKGDIPRLVLKDLKTGKELPGTVKNPSPGEEFKYVTYRFIKNTEAEDGKRSVFVSVDETFKNLKDLEEETANIKIEAKVASDYLHATVEEVEV